MQRQQNKCITVLSTTVIAFLLYKKDNPKPKNNENQDILIGLTNILSWFSIRPVQNEIFITIQSIKASESSKSN